MQPQTIRPLFDPPARARALLLAVVLTAGGPAHRALAQAASPSEPEGAAAAAAPSAASDPVLAPNAPQSYVVKRGDTLWGIAKVFLRDPWHWPEIWQANPQIHNPHLIYPGDTLRLVYVEGHPQLVLQRGGTPAAEVERGGAVRLEPRVRSTPLAAAITTIPYETVQAFMSKPSVLTREQIDGAPYILASLDNHAAIAQGNTIYARGFREAPAAVGTSYNVIRVGEPLRDPDSGRILGYNGIYTGSALVTRAGHPATLRMTQSAMESEPGDKLVPSHVEIPLDFVPNAPKERVSGRIIAVNDGVTMIGQYEVVVIDRGARDGLAAGDVLAVYKAGEVVRDDQKHGFMNSASTFFAPKVRLPDERSGTFMVFKTFDQISYGLIMEAQNLIRVGDRVENP